MEFKPSAPAGVVAGGSEEAAAAGEFILLNQGNAVDAAVAAVFTSFSAEPILTGPFGGGFALVGRPGEGSKGYQFFANAPGTGLGDPPPAPEDFVALEIDFGATLQRFHVGRGSTAYPLMLPGLLQLQATHGDLSLSQVLQPAIQAAKAGVVLTPQMGRMFEILGPLLVHSEDTRALYAPSGTLLRASERYHSPDLAPFLASLSSEGLSSIHDTLESHFGPPFGQLTPTDRDHATIGTPAPVVLPLGEYEVHLNPPPTSGGLLVALGLRLVEGIEPAVWADPAESMVHFLAAMAVTQEARVHTIDELVRSSRSNHEIIANVLRPSFINSWRSRFQEILRDGLPESIATSPDPGHTTHVSVVDAQGMACTITTSNGEGCSHVVPHTGVVANNFMGEEDLHPHGFHQQKPGTPLTSMMCPTLVFHNGKPILALGTGGSNRIRTTLLQVLTRHLLGGATIEEAVNAPRLHYEGGEVCVERVGFGQRLSDEHLKTLANKAHHPLSVFEEPNVFFGGINAAGLKGQGVGDLRRGGVVRVLR